MLHYTKHQRRFLETIQMADKRKQTKLDDNPPAESVDQNPVAAGSAAPEANVSLVEPVGTDRLQEARIHAACDAVNARGEKPTYKAVREELGTGSYSTISRFIGSWRPAESVIALDMPDDLSHLGHSLVASVWIEATKAATIELEGERASSKMRIDELLLAITHLEADLDVANENTHRLQTERSQLSARCDEAAQQLVVLRQQLAAREGEILAHAKFVDALRHGPNADIETLLQSLAKSS